MLCKVNSTHLNIVRSDALVRWSPRLPRLQGLELWDGKPLEDPLVHASLHEYCPNFNTLMIYTWWVSLGFRWCQN